jgi:hypothetical protein
MGTIPLSGRPRDEQATTVYAVQNSVIVWFCLYLLIVTTPVGSGAFVIILHRFPARSDGHHDG